MFQITLLNVNNDKVTVNSRKFVGNLTMVNEIVSKIDSQEAENSSIPQSNVNHGNNICDDEKDQLRALISKYVGIVASNPRKPTPVRNMTHRIITNDAQPVRMKPYRIPHAWDKEVSDQVQQMLDNGIIRPSSSPWNAPVILVKKKDDSMRFVCDFRGLNDVTKKDSYPLPHIRDVIDRNEGAQFWTTLDAASAYWSMPVAEEDKEKTAFSVPRGKFEFNVTPFGLCNAGASYQRMMDITLSGLPSDRVLAYMNDVVIFNGNFQAKPTLQKWTTSPPKAPLVPMFIPNAPMQFLSIDIAFLPKDNNGYQYLLLIGDIFSRFVQAVPLKDQTAPKIVDALLRNWIYIYGSPFPLLSDQGSNVAGEVMAEICNELGIEKRRSLAYHSQGNGFAERNVRTVKDLLRAVLLHRRLQRSKWRSILPGLVFALNASESKATRCVPYNVVL